MVGSEYGVYHESEIDTKISPKSLELWAFQPIWGLLLCDYSFTDACFCYSTTLSNGTRRIV